MHIDQKLLPSGSLNKHKPTWYNDWFNSPYYHQLYKNRNDQEAQHFLDHLSKHFQFMPEHEILDLACGKGRHAIYLHGLGLKVTGLDLAPSNIAHANCLASPRLSFRVHDMRENFGTDTYDFVLNLFTSFGYFEYEHENATVIKNIALSLKKNGRVVVDYLNPYLTLSQFVPHEVKEVNGIHFNIRREIERGFIRKFISVNIQGQNYHFLENVKLLFPSDFEAYFFNAGLKLTQLMGNYDLKPYEQRHSPRMILIGEK